MTRSLRLLVLVAASSVSAFQPSGFLRPVTSRSSVVVHGAKKKIMYKAPPPSWSTELLFDPFDVPVNEIILDATDTEAEVSVSVYNDEISWERYFTHLVIDGQIVDNLPCFVGPGDAHMAPKGGAKNIDKPSEPYSDIGTAVVAWKNAASRNFVRTLDKPGMEAGPSGEWGLSAPANDATVQSLADKDIFVVLRTECDQWQWRLIFDM